MQDKGVRLWVRVLWYLSVFDVVPDPCLLWVWRMYS